MKRTIGLLTAVALSGAAYAQDVKVGGYIDGGLNWTKDADPSTAFALNQLAGTISGTSGGSFGFLELSGTSAGVGATQYWGGHKYDGGLSWKVGLFNGLLGSEDNESPNRFFVHEGMVSGAFLSTYAGLHVAYAASDTLNLDLFIGNGQADAGGGVLLPTAGLNDASYAVKVSTKMDDVSAYVGAEVYSIADESGYNIDVGAHFKSGQLHAGAEVAMTKAAVANADSGFGFAVHAGYDVVENTQLLARFDWGNENFSATDYELTVGPTFKMSDAFNLRAHWSMDSDEAQGIDVMGVYKF